MGPGRGALPWQGHGEAWLSCVVVIAGYLTPLRPTSLEFR